MIRSVVTTMLFAVAVLPAAGQDAVPDAARDLRRDTLTGAQPFQLEPVVVPGSEHVSVGGLAVDSSRIRIDYRYGRLWVNDLAPADTVVVTYRTLPYPLQEVYRRNVPTVAAPDETGAARPPPEPLLPSSSRLQHSGSITRGILAGNRRDVTVESGLRMQLSGEIADGVSVQAVLTDQNTPILPEGTTQRIEEFDRVYIGIDSPYGTAQLGDFDLRFDGSEFGRFARKLQGASIAVPLPAVGAFAGGSVVAAGATSRGVYREQEIEPIDGVQGPYRLQGAQGEQFVLVVPGSETVYVDGGQLTRGETNDYTIDYATAEITFTPGVIVTADKRIRVEYEYTTSRYTRSLIGTEVQTSFWPTSEGARARFGVAYLREADSRDFSEELGFGHADSLALVDAGDGVAASGGAERVDFDPEALFVQYRRQVRGTDTVYVALERAPDEGDSVYRVQFSRVGEGEGSYARVGRSVNGILYEYRGDGGGSYLPVRLLPKPSRHQLIDVNGAVEPVAGLEMFGEWAGSIYDQNRLSSLDSEDDGGRAYTAGVRLEPADLGLARLSGEASHRFVSGSFAAFNRIRPVEFERRWNLPDRAGAGAGRSTHDETIEQGTLRLDVMEGSSVRGEFGHITLGNAFESVRRAGFLTVDEEGWPVVDYRIERIASRDEGAVEHGRWWRQLGAVRLPTLGGRFTPRLEVEHEDRQQRVSDGDSLARPSFRFVEIRPGISWEEGALEADGFVERRTENDWLGGRIVPAATSWTGRSTVRYRPSSTLDLDGSAGFRVRSYTDRFRIEQHREDVRSLLLRLNTGYRPLQRAVQLNVLYEGMTERTPTLQEIYVRTGPAIGQYVWEDANGDGIVQIDEMVPERLPNEGTYVQTFIPSDTLTSVVNVQSRIRLELDPARLWQEADTRWKRWLANVQTRTVLEVTEKTRDPHVAAIYLLRLDRFRDRAHTMSGRFRAGQDVFLFRARPNYGVDVAFSQLRSLNELAAGEEVRFVNSWRVEGRFRPDDQWGLRFIAAAEQDRLTSDTHASRRYDIEGLRAEPEVSFAVTDRVQLVGSAAFGLKNDAVGDRRARIAKLPLELRYTVPRTIQLTARVEVADVALDGSAVGLARFELTDGRGPGTSTMWTLRGQYTLNEYLRATFSYDGRAPAGAPVVHTMQLQLSALF